MSQYGDRGNVVTVVRRCASRGLDVEIDSLEVGDWVDPDRVDLLVMRGGADSHQRLSKRHGTVDLAPLDDGTEDSAHDRALQQATARPKR